MLRVVFSDGAKGRLEEEKEAALKEILENDPRPAYQDDGERIYGFGYADKEIKFRVEGGTLTVLSIE